jgi:hypothetical protein
MPSISVRFRTPINRKKDDYPEWGNNPDYQIYPFRSWRKAWEFIDSQSAVHPLTREDVLYLRKHCSRWNVGEVLLQKKDDDYFIDVFGVDEKADKKAYYDRCTARLDAISTQLDNLSQGKF